MKTRIFHWVFSLGFMAAALPVGGEVKTCSDVSLVAGETVSPAGRHGAFHPIKKRVGRAVSSTIDRIDNPWFVISQILIPLCILLFSLMYVRRYRAKQAAEGDAPTPHGGETDKDDDPGA